MKKIVNWLYGISLAVLLIDWCVLGLKLLDGDYDNSVEIWIAAVCWALALFCALYKAFSRKCPHCRKLRMSGGAYCSHCGKQIDF